VRGKEAATTAAFPVTIAATTNRRKHRGHSPGVERAARGPNNFQVTAPPVFLNLYPEYRNQPIPGSPRVGIHYVQKEGWGRWHGLRLTDVPAAASLLRLRRKSQKLKTQCLRLQSAVRRDTVRCACCARCLCQKIRKCYARLFSPI
jgi:hypothetical protein